MNTLIGKVLRIFPTDERQASNGKTYKTRKLWLDLTKIDQYSGERGYDEFHEIEFAGDKCAMLDSYQSGDIVKLTVALTGRGYTYPAGHARAGEKVVFNRTAGIGIEAYRSFTPTAAPSAPVQQPTQQVAQQSAPVAQATPFDEQPGNNDDLPF